MLHLALKIKTRYHVVSFIGRRSSCKYCVYILNKKHLINVGPIHHCEPPHVLILHYCHSPGVATVARRLRIDVHDNDDNNDNA